jgi:hypothetical protein
MTSVLASQAKDSPRRHEGHEDERRRSLMIRNSQSGSAADDLPGRPQEGLKMLFWPALFFVIFVPSWWIF